MIRRIRARPRFTASRRPCRRVLALLLLSGQAGWAPAASAGAAPAPEPAAGALVTEGSVKLGTGTALDYTAIAGLITVGGDDATDAALAAAPRGIPATLGPAATDGPPIARMSYVSYSHRGGSPGRRPIVFIYDGGPGASTRGMLVTSFGPVRVRVPPPGQGATAESVEDNPDTLLDVADLVFIDPPGTGFGRIEGRNAPATFYGIDGDAAALDRFIERFITRSGRQGTPLFLLGHSYGTVRNAVVAKLLADDDLPPAGIISISSFLNIDDFLDIAPANPGTDSPYVDALPSYAAIAWYHHRLDPRPSQLEPLLADAEAFALGDYASALLAGADLPEARAQAVAARLQDFTGIPAATWLRARLRIGGTDFAHLLLGDGDHVVGRLDARYVGTLVDPLAPGARYDAFEHAVAPGIAAAADRYERTTLGFGPTAVFSADADVPELRWNNDHVTTGHPWESFYNVMPDLATVLTREPDTRLLVFGGYYDLSSTFLAAKQELSHLPVPLAVLRKVDVAFFPTGHEPYLEDQVRHTMHDRIARFIVP